MKRLSERTGIERLAGIREEFRREIEERFEHRAKPCSVCETPGACCLDEHFVNVRVSRLESSAIRKAVKELSREVQTEIFKRLERIEPDAEFYACPLYESGAGCLVHSTAKPLPCIAHACYERKEDLPPDELLSRREIEIDDLNRRVYGRSEPQMPIHAAF
jgi:hypothetical protein